jgi:hypothetical protein
MAEIHSMPNRRGEDRKQVLFKTAINVGDISTQCEIRNIGPGGVRIAAALSAAPQTPVMLVIDQPGEFAARVAWVRRGELDLKFDEPPARIYVALELIAT